MQIDVADERTLDDVDLICIRVEPIHMFRLKIISMVMNICIIILSIIHFSFHYTRIIYICTSVITLFFILYDIFQFEQYVQYVDSLTIRSRWIVYSVSIPCIQDLVIYSIGCVNEWVRICVGLVTLIVFMSSMKIDTYIKQQYTKPAICCLIVMWLCIFSLITFFTWCIKGSTNMLNVTMNMCMTWMYLLFGVTTSSHFSWICSKDPQISRRVDVAYNIVYSLSTSIIGVCLFFYYQREDEKIISN